MNIDPEDPLFRPLTIAEAAQRVGKTTRTVRRWIAEQRITAYEMENPREVVLIERHVVELDKANDDAFARGRPPKHTAPPSAAA